LQLFEYGANEIANLKSRDKILGVAIDRIGMIKREVNPDPFTALISSVISQQISKQAAKTIQGRLYTLLGDVTPESISAQGRLYTLLGEVTPESISATNITLIKGCGLSERKAGYLKGLAEAAISGEVDFTALPGLPDEEVIAVLTSLRGVGVWTAEMILLFSLRRPDIVSYRDLAIRRGMMNLYGLQSLTPVVFEQYRKHYSPYGSVASLYLWALSSKNE